MPDPNEGDAIVRVIVVNFNGGKHLSRCIDALLAQTCRRFEAVIVDNASTDGSLDTLRSDPRLRIKRLANNVGFATANNIAASGAVGPFLAFLNPDAIPEPHWLDCLLAAATRNLDAHLFGSLQLKDDDPSCIDGAGDVYFFAGLAWRNLTIGNTNPFSACAAAALIRREWFEKLCGFDEDYFCYLEDIDLGFRLRLMGGEVLQVNDAVVRHVGSAITGVASDFAISHTTRNQVWTFIKNMPWPLLIVVFPAHVSLVLWQTQRARFRGQSGLMLTAIWTAFRGIRPVLAKRRRIQASRTVSVLALAQAMTWSPAALRRRTRSGQVPL